jgi:tetratricopeptide (TPR) repeat protein
MIVLPWLLAGGMFLLYLFTLDRWVSLESLRLVAWLEGMIWSPELSGPVTYLISYPFRWLHPATIPLALNIFTAGCAALTLALLARSVALLPHDRTRAERQRNSNRQRFLETRNAWLPPALAVLVCGLGLAFWKHAIAGTGEMLDVLLFAYLVRCLLEYRIDQQDAWLLKFALVLGLAMANNWAMVAFFPAFLIAVLWIKGIFNFFSSTYVALFLKEKRRLNLRLAGKMTLCWLAGASLLLLLPLLASRSGSQLWKFWPAVRYVLHSYCVVLGHFPLRMLLLLSVTSGLPVFFMGIRWGGEIDDAHPFAVAAMHVIHAFFLAICLWAALDAPFSPSQVQPAFACLPLYYLGALSVGYFSGYFLLVFGPRTAKLWLRPRALAPYANLVSIGVIWLLLALAPAVLADKNLPDIQRRKHDPLADYFDRLRNLLPGRGTVVMSQDATKLNLLRCSLIRAGRQSDYVLVDSSLISHYPAYFQELNARQPEFKLSAALDGQPSAITNPVVLLKWVSRLTQKAEVCFLHPFAGFLGEFFYAEPHGLYYQLNLYPTNELQAPPLSPELMAANSNFWQSARRENFPEIIRRIQPHATLPKNDVWRRLLEKAHTQTATDRNAQLAGAYYSLMLNAWGVALQRAGPLAEAGKCFAEALELNPENTAAQINLECNQALQAHQAIAAESYREVDDRLGRNGDWDLSLREDGPVDEPNACDELGALCRQTGIYRQAAQYYQRAETLAPQATNAPLRLGELLLATSHATEALAAARHVLDLDPNNTRALVLEALSLVQLQEYYQAIPPLDDVLNSQTNNTEARLTRALAYLKLNKLAAAQADYQQVVEQDASAYPAYSGLAAVADAMKDTPNVVKYSELYLSNAPPGLPEAEQVKAWLKEFKPPEK